jgi:hypothetical protein
LKIAAYKAAPIRVGVYLSILQQLATKRRQLDFKALPPPSAGFQLSIRVRHLRPLNQEP